MMNCLSWKKGQPLLRGELCRPAVDVQSDIRWTKTLYDSRSATAQSFLPSTRRCVVCVRVASVRL
eukprot:6299857-Amphidinium_carterae.1